jgi:hypothetical protein
MKCIRKKKKKRNRKERKGLNVSERTEVQNIEKSFELS